MVLAERNTELVRNGRRSRGPSPNGHGSGGGSSSLGNVGGGTVTPDSSDDDNSIKRNGKSKTKQSEYEEKIRVGRDYQAVCPPLIPENERKPEVLNDRALLVWSPTKEIPDPKLEEYISVAKEKYGYNGEQALGMLFWHKHDLERAVMDLANFTPFPDEWTVEDKVLFEQAFQFHGKSFHRIRQMLPDKSIASLVKYYYSWKKTRHRQSVMDRQEKAKASKEGSENGSDNGSNEESDNDDKDQVTASTSTSGSNDQINAKAGGIAGAAGVSVVGGGNAGNEAGTGLVKQTKSSNELNDGDNESTMSTPTATANSATATNAIKRQQTPPNSTTTDSSGGRSTPTNATGGGGGAGGYCTNCGVACHLLHSSPHGKLCFSCHHHWRRTGNKRPTTGPSLGKRSRDYERHKRKPPRGMYINHDDIVTLASAPENEDKFIANIDREIVSLLTQVQFNKKTISALKKKNCESTEDLRAPENTNRINARWTNDEVLMGVECVRKFGKDFQAIAETIGTKTEAHVRTFYLNYRRRYNLDQLAKQHEAEKEANTAAAVASSSSASNAGSASSNETNATASTTANLAGVANSGGSKKDELKKKEAATASNSSIGANDESDNTNSSETTASKSVNSESKTSNFTDSNNAGRKDNIVMEIDLDAEQADGPPNKKFALSVANQDFPKSNAV